MFRIFDQISFYSITEAELDAAQASGAQGDLVRIEDGVLDLAAHEAWVNANHEDIAATAARRARAIEAAPFLGELTRPSEAADSVADGSGYAEAEEDDELDEEDGYERVKAGIPGRCWRLLVKEGDRVTAGSVLVSLSVHFVLLWASFISCGIKLTNTFCCPGIPRVVQDGDHDPESCRWCLCEDACEGRRCGRCTRYPGSNSTILREEPCGNWLW